MWKKAGSAALLAAMAWAACGQAQEPPRDGGAATRGGGGGPFAGMQRVAGEVTAVNGANLTVKSEDGQTITVVTTDNTRVFSASSPAKVADVHVGDGLGAMGNLDVPNHTLHAAVLTKVDAAQVKALRENLGKTYITGRVTAIDLDNARMTVERSDRVAQVIGFDETTSFKRSVRGGQGPAGGGGTGQGPARGGFGMGMPTNPLNAANMPGESITLADIKVGDRVVGDGGVKNGTFVPTHLVDTGAPGEGRTRQRNPDAGTGTAMPPPGQ